MRISKFGSLAIAAALTLTFSATGLQAQNSCSGGVQSTIVTEGIEVETQRVADISYGDLSDGDVFRNAPIHDLTVIGDDFDFQLIEHPLNQFTLTRGQGTDFFPANVEAEVTGQIVHQGEVFAATSMMKAKTNVAVSAWPPNEVTLILEEDKTFINDQGVTIVVRGGAAFQLSRN